MEKKLTIIFTDGACSGNPGPGGWAAIVCLPDGTVHELGGGEQGTTNNRMELTGAIESLKSLNVKSLTNETSIYTDSTYVIRGVTQWIFGWRKNQWITSEGQPVVNQDLWKELDQEVGRLRNHTKLNWYYSRGHSGIPGNERCDVIAVDFSKGLQPQLYHGSLDRYSVALFPLPPFEELPEMKPRNGVKAKPLCYLSLVNGKLERHPDWTSCEARVKGRPGAKFKKAMSEQEVEEILRVWGVK